MAAAVVVVLEDDRVALAAFDLEDGGAFGKGRRRDGGRPVVDDQLAVDPQAAGFVGVGEEGVGLRELGQHFAFPAAGEVFRERGGCRDRRSGPDVNHGRGGTDEVHRRIDPGDAGRSGEVGGVVVPVRVLPVAAEQAGAVRFDPVVDEDAGGSGGGDAVVCRGGGRELDGLRRLDEGVGQGHDRHFAGADRQGQGDRGRQRRDVRRAGAAAALESDGDALDAAAAFDPEAGGIGDGPEGGGFGGVGIQGFDGDDRGGLQRVGQALEVVAAAGTVRSAVAGVAAVAGVDVVGVGIVAGLDLLPVAEAVAIGIDVRDHHAEEGGGGSGTGHGDFQIAVDPGVLSREIGPGVGDGGRRGGLELVALAGLGGPAEVKLGSVGGDFADGEDVPTVERVGACLGFLEIAATVAIAVGSGRQTVRLELGFPDIAEAVGIEVQIGAGGKKGEQRSDKKANEALHDGWLGSRSAGGRVIRDDGRRNVGDYIFTKYTPLTGWPVERRKYPKRALRRPAVFGPFSRGFCASVDRSGVSF